jgi:hypothetical protein
MPFLGWFTSIRVREKFAHLNFISIPSREYKLREAHGYLAVVLNCSRGEIFFGILCRDREVRLWARQARNPLVQ